MKEVLFRAYNVVVGVVILCSLITGVFATPQQANAQTPTPRVAIHVSELTQALEAITATSPGTPTGAGTTGYEWWYTSWHYFVAYESLEEALRSDGTPFIEVTDADIAAGHLLNVDGSPKYPILISLASEAIADNEIIPLQAYVSAGGFLFAGSSSFTRNPDGTTRGNFALASEMGLHMANPYPFNWGGGGIPPNNHFTKIGDHRLTSDIPSGTLPLNGPLTSEEIPWGVSSSDPLLNHIVHGPNYAWQVVNDNATVIANGDYGPLLTVKNDGLGKIIFHGPFQPLIGHGGNDTATFAYLIYRRAIEWAFESFSLPVVKVSPWPYPYDAAFMVRHDFENNQSLIQAIPSSASFEHLNGVKGDYFFCTGALRDDMAVEDRPSAITGLQNAVSNGATIGSHNGGLKNPVNTSLLQTDYDYWHWGPDEALDATPPIHDPPYADGKAYAKASILASFSDIEGWLSGLNHPRIWAAPYYNGTREGSRDILDQLGAVVIGEQKISPFPSRTLSYNTMGTYYSPISLPVSEWYKADTTIAQNIEGHTTESIHAAVDFYYNLGALINVYGHERSDLVGVQQEYVTHSLSKGPRLWSTNTVGINDWWRLRSNVVVTPTVTTTGNTYTVTASVSGATDPDSAIELALPQIQGKPIGNMTVSLNGILADPSKYRTTAYGVKVLVGTSNPTVQVQYTLGASFSGLNSTITYGTASTTLSGTISGGSVVPTGSVVITLNGGETHSATINGSGYFSSNFTTTGTLGVAGSPYPIDYNYQPGDSTYSSISATGTLTVSKATPTITWANPADITYGTALSATQLNATSGGVSGSFVYTPLSGTVLNAGNGQTLSVTFTPTDTANYNNANKSVTINVNKATPTITWANPADITYGTALSATQLNATSGGVSGSFVYTPLSGTVLNAGNGQTLSVTFTPTDTANYNNANKSVTINVNKATPTITWANPADITYGTALSATQLNATSGGVSGSFVYTPLSGTVLNAGNGQTLSVTFTPTVTANYNNANKSVTINVNKATPTLSVTNSPVIYNGATQSATVTGSVAGTVSSVQYGGSSTLPTNANTYAVTANFAPTDTTNYNSLTGAAAGNFVINKATPTITWANPADITYGTALSATQLNATSGGVSGSFVYTPLSGTVLNAGNGQTLSVTFTPTDTANYNNANKSVTINVNKATPTITWANPADITYGTALSATQLNATSGGVSGSFVYTPLSGTVLNAGNGQTLSVTFTPTVTANYNSTNKSVTINVNKANSNVTVWPTASAIILGQTLASSTLSGGSATPVGSFGFTTPTIAPPAGTAQQSVTYTPTDTANYNVTTGSVSVTVRNHPVSVISSISPTTRTAHGAAFTLTVNGNGFFNGFVVKWNGVNHTTAFVSATQLRAAIPAADIATTGMAQVTVTDPSPGGGTSNAQTLTIVPVISSITPTSQMAGGAAFTLTVNGNGFNSSSLIQWNGVSLLTAFVSATQLKAAILSDDIATAGTAQVTVLDSTPGVGSSNAKTLTINNPVPKTTSLSPTSAIAGGADFDLTVNGSNFVASSVIRWNGVSRTTTFVSPTKLTATITAASFDIAAAGTAKVTVFNPTPGGATSTAQTFTINNPLPTTTSLSPAAASAGGPAFTLTVNGTGFVNGSVVKWNGVNHTTTFVSDTQLKAAITAANIATAGTASVTVFNPTPGGGTSLVAQTFTMGNPPVPAISSITPTPRTAGGLDFTLTVNGSRFVKDFSVVQWNGTPRITTFVSATKLTAAILADDIATAGTAQVTVFTSDPTYGGTSNAKTLTINNPVPTTTSLSPTSTTKGGPDFDLTVNGSNFNSSSVVRWKGVSRTTTFVSPTQLKAAITAADIQAAGTAAVTVFNPTPGGGTSVARTFTINNPVPTTTSLSPAAASAGGPAFTLTVNGTGFVNGSVVKWNGVNHTTTFGSDTQLTAAITAADIATAGTAAVTVFNPTPGGGTSTPPLSFTKGTPPVPAISSITPATRTAGGAAFTLTVNGSRFVNGSTVKWNGVDRTTHFVSATQLTASITDLDIAAAGTATVTVFTSDLSYGGTSNAKTLTINNPVPTTTSLSPTSTTKGGPDFDLTVNGSNFNSSSVVRWKGVSRTTTFVSPTQLKAAITAADIQAAGTAQVTVFNPTPGGGTSTARTFTIIN